MGIYRGPGGTGDAVNDAASEAVLVSQLVTQAQTSEANAATSATAASGSATTATTQATNASTSATNAATSASSASTSATNAAASASTATTKASEASTSATNAASSASAASTSATAASGSASTATTQATNASNSASAASTSATNASNSATAAATSATNAASSATSASGSASTATTQASNASTSATNAASSATSASGSATTATTQAGIATTKAGEAATSATNAATSATSAGTSATNAASSASSASTSASTATTKAAEASTSATNAAASATSASGSASTATTQAGIATTQATNASSSASSASTSATTATTQAGIATTKASDAATSATAASGSATSAATSATNASNSATSAGTSATNASNSATSAATSATNAAASYDSFDDRYLGAKSTAPTVDNDGNTLLVGALYFNTVSNFMKVWDGSSWLDAYASLSGALLAANNLSDLTNTATARTNLGVAIGTNVQAYDADLAAIAALTPTADNFIVGNGTTWTLETPAQARTSLGLGTAATTASTDYATAAQGTLAGTALQPATIGSTVQGYDADLQAIGAIAGTLGLLKKTAANTWSLDTNTYLTSAVTSVTGTSPVSSSGGNTPAISLASGYGDTQNPYASKTANYVLAAPNGASGVPTFRAVVAADIPTLNQNTTGTASNVTGVVAAANGGTGQSSYAVGDLVYASTTTALSKLADIATGNALISGGVGVAPSYGKIGLTTHISGTLAFGNGGTGATTRQDAMDALAGAVTSGSYLRGNGTDVVMSTIQAADVPTLNQNTTGSSGSCTGNAATATTATNQSGGTVAATTGSFSGLITSSVGGTAISFTGAGSNTISWNQSGAAAPTFTTRSAGTKLVLYPNLSGSTADFALGIEGSTLWNSVPSTAEQFKWYGGTTLAATLSGTGNLTTVGTVTATNHIGPGTGLTGTAASLTAGAATTLATGRTLAITGDLTYTSPSFNGSANVTAAGTLATVNSNVGAFGSSTSIPVVTVNAKGLVTAVSTATVAGGQYFGSAATKAIAYNANTIGENVTVTAGNNGLSAGPITVSTGFTVTVQTGAAWVIV